jgi:Mor family transcriptional regulator
MTTETTQYLQWKIEAVIRQSGYVRPEYAADLMQLVVDGLREDFGGERVWLPALDKSERNQAIVKAFTGRNHYEVCRQFGISRATLYRIIAAPL